MNFAEIQSPRKAIWQRDRVQWMIDIEKSEIDLSLSMIDIGKSEKGPRLAAIFYHFIRQV